MGQKNRAPGLAWVRVVMMEFAGGDGGGEYTQRLRRRVGRRREVEYNNQPEELCSTILKTLLSV